MGLILRNNAIIKNLVIGGTGGSGGGNSGGGGGASLYSSNVLFHYDIGDTNSYGGTGTTITDLSGNGYNVPLIDTPSYTSSGTSSFMRGGRIYHAVGSTNPYSNLYGEGGTTTPSLTYSTWARVNTSSTMEFFNADNTTNPIVIKLASGNLNTTIKRENISDPSSIRYDTSAINTFSNVVANGNWFNLALVLDELGHTIYINGTAEASNSINTGTTSGKLFGGTSGADFQYDFRSGNDFAQAIFYNEALTASQISTNFDALKSRYGY